MKPPPYAGNYRQQEKQPSPGKNIPVGCSVSLISHKDIHISGDDVQCEQIIFIYLWICLFTHTNIHMCVAAIYEKRGKKFERYSKGYVRGFAERDGMREWCDYIVLSKNWFYKKNNILPKRIKYLHEILTLYLQSWK